MNKRRKHTRHDDVSWGKVAVWLTLLAIFSIIAALWDSPLFHATLIALRSQP